MLYLLTWTVIAIPFGVVVSAIDYILYKSIVKNSAFRIALLVGVIAIGSWMNYDDEVLALPFLPRKRDFVECLCFVGVVGVFATELLIGNGHKDNQ